MDEANRLASQALSDSVGARHFAAKVALLDSGSVSPRGAYPLCPLLAFLKIAQVISKAEPRKRAKLTHHLLCVLHPLKTETLYSAVRLLQELFGPLQAKIFREPMASN